jgi:hypothetical protein
VYKLGVIPAAGNGSRWGGYHKELLPCGNGGFMIDHTIDAMSRGGADALLIIANVDKIGLLSRHLSRNHRHLSKHPGLPIFYVIQCGTNDIWSAIVESFGYPADRYLFAMPDTLYPVDAFEGNFDAPFLLGVHQTDEPERFGVLREGRVVNKQPGKSGLAWGLLSWSWAVVELWQRRYITDYTDGINKAIEEFGLSTWDIRFYRDMASFNDYQGWLCQ